MDSSFAVNRKVEHFYFFFHAAVDDIEEGKGADEELCLLPDEEREISDADKERALQNQQQDDENDEQENEANEITTEGVDENGKINCQMI